MVGDKHFKNGAGAAGNVEELRRCLSPAAGRGQDVLVRRAVQMLDQLAVGGVHCWAGADRKVCSTVSLVGQAFLSAHAISRSVRAPPPRSGGRSPTPSGQRGGCRGSWAGASVAT